MPAPQDTATAHPVNKFGITNFKVLVCPIYLRKMKMRARGIRKVNEDLSTLVKVLLPTVEWRKVEHGIAVRPTDQPALERIVGMPANVRDKVSDWLQNPKN
jgi:hypothetical protein